MVFTDAFRTGAKASETSGSILLGNIFVWVLIFISLFRSFLSCPSFYQKELVGVQTLASHDVSAAQWYVALD